MFNLTDEFFHITVINDAQAPALYCHAQTAGRKGTDEHHLFGVLADVDESAGPREPGSELTHVQIALLIRLGKSKKGRIEASAVVEVELIGLIDDGLRIGRR
ncbi:MAG TPA: hypothetical protein VLJ17_04135, partial [Xanthobacteraceae bacterium]|nr:hypothetical protein [Xanthobacteraceae bacterium]